MNSSAKWHVDAKSPSTMEAKNYLATNLGHQIHREHISLTRRPCSTSKRLCADASHTSCFTGKGRNVVMDNFFTSLSLVKQLNAKKTSLLRTMSKMKWLSPSVKANMLENYSQQKWWQLARQLHCTHLHTCYTSYPNLCFLKDNAVPGQ